MHTTHSAGIAWILRAVMSLWLIAVSALSPHSPFAPGRHAPPFHAAASAGAYDPDPGPLDLSSPVTLSQGAANGTALWGDYDNDGDLDLLVTGIGRNEQPTTILWKNTSGAFAAVNTALPQVEAAAAAWGDYDNDNDLDLLIMGQASFTNGQINGLARIYRNDAGVFTHLTSAVLPQLHRGWGDWGDYDNDGDLDLLLSGYYNHLNEYAGIYRNDGGGIFTDIHANLTEVGFSHSTWGDFDNDNDLDLVLIGLAMDGPVAKVYRQDYANGPQFTEIAIAGLPGLWNGTTSWVDLDNNGYLDLLLTGNTSDGPGSASAPKTVLYRYQSGGFVEDKTVNLPHVWTSSTAWGDYDNDGDPDLALNGLTVSERITQIYQNEAGASFTPVRSLPPGFGLSLAWGNYDGDANRALDLVVSGQDKDSAYTTQIYRGLNVPANQPPATPNHNTACWDPATDRLLLDWSSVTDDHTATSGITYALRVGTTPGGAQIMSPAANPNNGYRRTAQPGPMFAGSYGMLRGLNPGRYYWSVQAIDSAFTGGQFSTQGIIDYGAVTGVNDSALTIEGLPVTISALANDSTERGALEIDVVSDPSHGDAVVDPTNPARIIYTPDPNFFGTDHFYYHPRDALKYCSRAYVTVTVLPISPDPPTGITLTPAAVNENLPSGSKVGTLETDDPDNPYDSHTYTLVAGEGSQDNALFSIRGDRLNTRGPFDYETRLNYSVRIRSTDGSGLWVEQAFAIQVLNVMEAAPVIVWNGTSADTVTVTMSEDGLTAAEQPDPFVLSLTAEDADPGDILSWSIVTPAARGTAQVDPVSLAPGDVQVIHYTPDADTAGPDSFVVQVTDSGGLYDTITVNVNIIPVNDPPYLDPLYDITLAEWSGPQVIPLAGLRAGGLDETEPLQMTVTTDKPALIADLQVVETSPGVAEIRFTMRGGAGPGTITLTLNDGQPDHNTAVSTFTVYAQAAGSKLYIPILLQYP